MRSRSIAGVFPERRAAPQDRAVRQERFIVHGGMIKEFGVAANRRQPSHGPKIASVFRFDMAVFEDGGAFAKPREPADKRVSVGRSVIAHFGESGDAGHAADPGEAGLAIPHFTLVAASMRLEIKAPHVDGFSVGILSHGRFRLRRFVEMGMTIFGTGIFLPIFPNSFFQVRIMRTCLDGLPNHSYRAFGDLDVVRDPSIAPRHALRLHQYDFDRFAFVFVGSTQSVRRVGTGGEDPRIRRRAEVNPALDRFVRTKRDVRLEPMKSVAENVFVGGSVVENVQRRELDTVLHRLNVRLAGLDVRPDPRLRSRIEDDLNRQDILDRRVVHGRFGK